MQEETVANPVTRPVTHSSAENDFAFDTARYFKSFLETRLHETHEPLERMAPDRVNGLMTGMRLDRYPQLQKNLYKNVVSGFVQETFAIGQNKYVAHHDDSLHQALLKATGTINQAAADTLAEGIARRLQVLRLRHPNDMQAFLRTVESETPGLFVEDFAAGFLSAAKLDAPEVERRLADDLAEKLTADTVHDILSIARTFYAGGLKYDQLVKEANKALQPEVLTGSTKSFLDELSVTDAYQELYRLHRTNGVLAGTDLYLHFCSIGIHGKAYPLFYMPLISNHAYPSVTLGFGSTVFVNWQAVRYVVQEYNRLMQLDLEIPKNTTNAITIDADNRKEMLAQAQKVVDVITTLLDLDKGLKLDGAPEQSVSNAAVNMTNGLYLAVYEKSADPIAMDYSEILQPGSRAGVAFADMMNAFIRKRPEQLNVAVAEEWKAKSISERLLFENPWPSNDQQKQTLMAAAKAESKVIAVQGAAGTGKTHFATNIAMQALAQGQSCLVLSRNAASLESVQNNVTATLADVRGEYFHTPLFWLGNQELDSFEDTDGQLLQKLQAFHDLYTKLQVELKNAKNRKVKDVTELLDSLVTETENVNLQEVEQIVHNEAKFADRDWIQDEPIEDINADLQSLHQAVQFIRSSDANYLLPYIDSKQQEIIADFIDIIREYQAVNRNVQQRLPEFVIRYRKLLKDQKQRLHGSLSYINSNSRQNMKILAADPITSRLKVSETTSFGQAAEKQELLEKLIETANGAQKHLGSDKSQNQRAVNELLKYDTEPEDIIDALNLYVDQVVTLKSKIFGFSGRTLVIENLTRQLKKSIPNFSLAEPEKKLEDLRLMAKLLGYTIEQLAQRGFELVYWKEVLHILKSDRSHLKELQEILGTLTEPAEFEFMAGQKIADADNLIANISMLQYANEMNDLYLNNPGLSTLFGIKSIASVLKQPDAYGTRVNKLSTDLEEVQHLEESKTVIKNFIRTYPDAAKRVGVNYARGNLEIVDDTFSKCTVDELKEYLAFKKKELDIRAYFRQVTNDSYVPTMRDLTQITTTQLSHSLDAKLMRYIEARAAELQALRQLLNGRQKINQGLFSGLQQLFPCMLADVREYAAYIPLKPEQFDIVIIDDAAGVSVAEIMPALLRAKKVIVLGDQFQHGDFAGSDVSQLLNKVYRDRLIGSLTEMVSAETAEKRNRTLELAKNSIDINVSALAFCRQVANYQTTFTNYFQSSPELIGYADKHFYEGSLQCLKAQALPIKESVRIDAIESNDATLHTNPAEAQYIMQKLEELKEANYEGTIGILTPYDEQAVLLQELIDESVINEWFDKRDLKIMTFDTCQGTAKDYVFISFVASGDHDRLAYDFPDSKDVPAAHGTWLMASALSTARTTVHFVLSKPVSKYSGVVGDMLHHYQSLISGRSKKNSASSTDILMAGESLLPQYFYATKFYKKHADAARLVSDFSLGDLVKPLLPDYKHPKYKVDFLVALEDKRIIISYDEFKDKFLSIESGSKDSSAYLTADEIYAQKLLEGYGYRFLRLNKYSLGVKPIETLDRLLADAVKSGNWPQDNGFVLS